MNKDKVLEVTNRSSGTLSYRIPDEHISRFFNAGETKKITYGELEKLAFQMGGKELINDYLLIQDKETIEELDMKVEPEYWMKEENVQELLEKASLEEFLDALDFAPIGVIELIKDLAVKLPLNDRAKAKALQEKTGFDVEVALRNTEDEEEKVAPKAERRIKAEPTEETTLGRRTLPNYNIVK